MLKLKPIAVNGVRGMLLCYAYLTYRMIMLPQIPYGAVCLIMLLGIASYLAINIRSKPFSLEDHFGDRAQYISQVLGGSYVPVNPVCASHMDRDAASCPRAPDPDHTDNVCVLHGTQDALPSWEALASVQGWGATGSQPSSGSAGVPACETVA